MPDFTAKDVQALRQATGAGMMDAKKALEANDGDFEGAVTWLREKGLGKAGERADRDRLTVSVGGVLIAAEGMQVPDYDEAPVAAHMKGQEIEIAVDVGIGEGRATVWTCDLTHAYIDINGNYRS